MSRRRSAVFTAISVFRLLGIIALPGVLAGCNAIGAIAYKVSGPPEVEARYVLPAEPTLVLVENYSNLTNTAMDSEMIARLTNRELEYNNLAPVIPLSTLLNVRNDHPTDFRQMSIPQIGRACGATQVVYVNLVAGGVSAVGGTVYQGKAQVMVRVVNVASGATVWPTDAADGFPVGYKTELARPSDTSTTTQIREELYDGLSVSIGRLFHKWKPDDLDDHSDD